MPEGVEDGIIRGMYQFNAADAGRDLEVQLFGSGAILRSALDAQRILADDFGVSSNVWSVTSYNQLRRDAHEARRWNMLHPGEAPRKSYVESQLEGVKGPVIAASDYVRAVTEQISPFVPDDFYALGTDGMGRSETREALRSHFEVDAQHIALAALHRLNVQGKVDDATVKDAIKKLEINPEKADPLFA